MTSPIRPAAETAPFRLRKDPAPVPATPITGKARKDTAPADAPRSRDWTDAALRLKITLLILVALTAGVGIGMIEAHAMHRIWPLMLGLALAALPLIHLGVAWVCTPIDRILQQLRRVSAWARGDLADTLPTQRTDEVGELARIAQSLALHANRDQADAKQLRRTLDDRIERATRMATRNLKELAMRDALTGLGNRRFLDEHLPALLESCRNANTDLVCVAIDMDNFKKINDTLGHGTGDELLRTLSQLIQGLIRHDDHAIRLGGDEFLILMPGISLARVRQLADQLHALFRQHVRVTIKGDIRPDLSLGAASMLRDNAMTPAVLLERADTFLYEAKRQGKGRLAGA